MYRGRSGYTIRGCGAVIFAQTRAGAEEIRIALKSGYNNMDRDNPIDRILREGR